MLQTTGMVFVSTELLTCSHIRDGLQIEHSLLQWLSVNGPRCSWDYNYVGLHLFMTIESVKDSALQLNYAAGRFVTVVV